MRFAVEQAYSPHYLKAELVFRPTLQYFKTLYIFNSVIEIMNIHNPLQTGIFFLYDLFFKYKSAINCFECL